MTSISLTAAQQQILEQTKQLAQHYLAHDRSGHDFAHIQRVVKLASHLLSTEPAANPLVVLVSAYLHDVIDDKVAADPAQALQTIKQFLAAQRLTDAEQAEILNIIQSISFRHNLDQTQALTLAGKIVQDADRLDALGAIGIGRTFYYGGHKGHIMYDPAIAPRQQLTAENYRQPNTVINHFYEKLLLLKQKLHTEEAKRIGEIRHQRLLDFVQAFEQEWIGEDF